MNKLELVEKIAHDADVSKTAASRVLDCFIETVTETLKNGDSVALIGFGTFKVNHRAARVGRNPKTGEPLQISEANIPAFSAGKTLKDRVKSV
ncbi:DNA-binding protein HU [Photobacterium carnosum]|uniref:DNA-binding protein HU n=1 Tax=Photobacterium carnosum TaxID=2023717 RepID=A0A2N4UW17_9GAMM|nr:MULTISPECIES: HU family DNA-binding protein [Photobacterium]MCD9475813.1 DNA-binding protein HU [Photobacterium phosphoreum]MCD9485864.1 DNA-binding protein HU [Photobacterium iliopiscarium]MCD9507675.1 DNA-binding protein HU [Photobacterium phosphoreum]MCD9538204.1 DNA-binding protein HU [Photobacterium carnosum]MCD9543008.1 DNA-binding protein HU [Photobacterium carnosum]